jgi:hypothetical protein
MDRLLVASVMPVYRAPSLCLFSYFPFFIRAAAPLAAISLRRAADNDLARAFPPRDAISLTVISLSTAHHLTSKRISCKQNNLSATR